MAPDRAPLNHCDADGLKLNVEACLRVQLSDESEVREHEFGRAGCSNKHTHAFYINTLTSYVGSLHWFATLGGITEARGVQDSRLQLAGCSSVDTVQRDCSVAADLDPLCKAEFAFRIRVWRQRQASVPFRP